MTSERPKPNLALRISAGLVAHWQLVASAVLMSAGVVGLSATYEDYCGQTDLTYAPPNCGTTLKLPPRLLVSAQACWQPS